MSDSVIMYRTLLDCQKMVTINLSVNVLIRTGKMYEVAFDNLDSGDCHLRFCGD